MSGYDHKIETSLEGIENLSKEKNEEIERKVKEKNHYLLKPIQSGYNRQDVYLLNMNLFFEPFWSRNEILFGFTR